MNIPILCDPSLPTNYHKLSPTKYVDIYIDDFIRVEQKAVDLDKIRCTILKVIDKIFRLLETPDLIHHTEPISVKKLRKGDGS